MRLSIQ